MKVFLNLTNGLEWLTNNKHQDFAGFVRIQSSHCERNDWDKVILTLDANLLMWVATGEKCVIVDYGANKTCSRANYQGVAFIRYCLYRCWFGREILVKVKGMNVTGYFRKCYNNLCKSARKKLKYFRKFVTCDTIELHGTSMRTVNDHDNLFYVNIFNDYIDDIKRRSNASCYGSRR